ncbi:MAG: TorD/DmsD family molecular chaperone [Candidatus Binatia bacterium]
MVWDRDLLAFRQGYYTLLVSFFWKEPAGELLLSLSDGIGERIHAARNLHPLLAEGWQEIKRFLAETPSEYLAETVADEYTQLFIGPHAPHVHPYESFYLTGRLLDRPLADVRTFLKAVGIEKQEGYAEPEDFIALELEVMRWSIGKQITAAHPEEETRWLRLQSDFLKEHLLVWVPTCAEHIEKAQGANFYRAAAMVLRGFLEVERTLLREWGLDKISSLEEARQRYGAIPTWKGPTFDLSDKGPKAPLPPREK